MTKGILGRKVGMTQVFAADGTSVPVTVIEAGPCHILQIRSVERDGYTAVQLGFLDKKRPKDIRTRPSKASRSERGHVAEISSKRAKRRQDAGVAPVPKANCEPKKYIREIRGTVDGYSVGQQLTVSLFDGIKAVDVVGYTKGRGYQGVMKRHGFKGQRATHGVKKCHRHQGGTGALAAWRGGGRPKKGKRMPGQYGVERVTIRNLKLHRVDADNNLLLVHGAVPGPVGAYVIVRETNMVG